jgi:hypothetical protein
VPLGYGVGPVKPSFSWGCGVTLETWIPVIVQIGVGIVAVYTTIITIRSELTEVRRLAENNRRDINRLSESIAYHRGRYRGDERRGDGRKRKKRS